MNPGYRSFGGKNFRGRGYNPRKQNWYKNKAHHSVPLTGPDADGVRTGTEKIRTKRIDVSSCGPYQGWKLYFQDESYRENSPTHRKIKAMEDFITRNSHLFSFIDIEERKICYVDLSSLYNDEAFNSNWRKFKDDLLETPENTIKCLELAVHQSIFTFMQNEAKSNLLEGEKLPSVHIPIIKVRIYNYETLTPLKKIKTSYYGKLVSVRGAIVRVGSAKLLCKWMSFYCSSCREIQCINQPEGVYYQPSRCYTNDCHSRSFTPLHSPPFTHTVSYQTVRLQEITEECGEVPRVIECELTEDLTSSCTPGEVVNLIGIVKIRDGEEVVKKIPNSYIPYINVISVLNDKTGSPLVCNKQMELNTNDYYAIQDIQSQTNLFKLLVNSLCPKIYGQEIVKAGLLLALFGGSRCIPDTRSDPHVLVVGDPGLGKTQMLQACVNVSPRGLFTSGTTSTRSGLTVTLVKDSGGYSLEAGALILTDGGCCAIDEFDKMTAQHQALLETMEQQSISIAKGGIICTLPARTSILAAANPVGGHYNPAKTVSENLSLDTAVLSRFDLVFIILDQPNELMDCLLTKHVMAQHSELKYDESQENASGPGRVLISKNKKCALSERLKMQHEETIDLLPHQLLRKYLTYAKEYVKPVLTPEACRVLQEFYLNIRRYHHSIDSTPITTRQLESLIRLTQARAKLELREEATKADAEDVIEIMKYTMVDTLGDGMGGLLSEPKRSTAGNSGRNQAKKFLAALQQQAKMQNRSMFSVQELKEVAARAQVQTSAFQSLIFTLNELGFLLKKSSKLYQLLSEQ